MNIDLISIIAFVVLMIIFLYMKRNKIVIQKIIYPFLYLFLYKTQFGIKFMNRTAKKYREWIKFAGYCSIGIGFLGMIFVLINIIYAVVQLITAPKVTTAAMALVLPGTNIPGVGYLSFWHWIIGIFVLMIIHEFSHGIVSEAHGIKIKNSGFGFVCLLAPVLPVAFVEPNEKKIKKQPDYIQHSIFAAGPVSNIVFAFIILLITFIVIAPINNSITEPVGFSFDIINETLPAGIAGLESGMIINSVNGETVSSYNDFINKVNYVRPDENLLFGVDDKEYKIITTAHPDNPSKGFIGIYNFKNEIISKPGYETFGSVFLWIAELFKWLFLLNLGVGLINLLPFSIADGGKMFSILLTKTIKDKKKVKRILGILSFLIILMILFSLFGHYLKGWGLF